MTEKLRAEFEAWANDSGLFDEPAEYSYCSECYIRDDHNIAFDAWVHATDSVNKKYENFLADIYQFAGNYDAPANVLDAIVSAQDGDIREIGNYGSSQAMAALLSIKEFAKKHPHDSGLYDHVIYELTSIGMF